MVKGKLFGHSSHISKLQRFIFLIKAINLKLNLHILIPYLKNILFVYNIYGQSSGMSRYTFTHFLEHIFKKTPNPNNFLIVQYEDL